MVETPIFGSYSHSFGPKRVEPRTFILVPKKNCVFIAVLTLHISVSTPHCLCVCSLRNEIRVLFVNRTRMMSPGCTAHHRGPVWQCG